MGDGRPDNLARMLRDRGQGQGQGLGGAAKEVVGSIGLCQPWTRSAAGPPQTVPLSSGETAEPGLHLPPAQSVSEPPEVLPFGSRRALRWG